MRRKSWLCRHHVATEYGESRDAGPRVRPVHDGRAPRPQRFGKLSGKQLDVSATCGDGRTRRPCSRRVLPRVERPRASRKSWETSNLVPVKMQRSNHRCGGAKIPRGGRCGDPRGRLELTGETWRIFKAIETFHRPRAPKPNREPLESRTLNMASEIDMRFPCVGIDTGRDT